MSQLRQHCRLRMLQLVSRLALSDTRTLTRAAITSAFVMAAVRSAYATDATLTGDTHVSSARPTVNYGNLSNVSVASGTTGLLQFDLTSLPRGRDCFPGLQSNAAPVREPREHRGHCRCLATELKLDRVLCNLHDVADAGLQCGQYRRHDSRPVRHARRNRRRTKLGYDAGLQPRPCPHLHSRFCSVRFKGKR